ncbi:type IV pilin protein [Halopseudomonas pelagia]|uniref:type IV pilin protein n=1 Tax=Halopseudomonas pelagia TaxID=553151 RepID=UPI0030DA9FFF|tara:strand:+ start:401 stop:811 length:411 start_codon:yes stop_codon:yes gene_type:complete
MYRISKGFTLIEIMIVVAIIGILVAIAYPSYDEYVKRGNRVEGQAFLSDAAARQERYYAQNYQYADSIAKLYGNSATTRSSETDKYTLGIGVNAGDAGYTLTATQQFNDTKCGNLTLNAAGGRGSSGSESKEYCWR